MKPKYISIIAVLALLPVTVFTQTPPTPPVPPQPPQPPQPPPERREKAPKVPVTFLGVDTSPVPPVVCEQMNLAKGFGLVVDYVVPGSPAAIAGIQQNDILKMLNDQILLEPSQLAKLVRSFSEGTNVTFTILRKGKEEKVTVKLAKKEMPQKWDRHGDFPFGDHDFGDIGDRIREQLEGLQEQMGPDKDGMIHDAVMKAHQEVTRARDEARREAQRARDQAREEGQRAREEAQRARDEAQRARDEARRTGGRIITQTDDNGLKQTKIDIGKAQIVFADDKGEMRLETMDGKKVLTAKDPQGRLLFSGPVETREELDKLPAEVRQRFEKLQDSDLPSVVLSDESPEDEDSDSSDEDENDPDDSGASTEQICTTPQSFPRNVLTVHTILI